MFVELCNALADRGKIVAIGEVHNTPTPHDRYISLFPFDVSIKEWVKTHFNKDGKNTVIGHTGIHYLPYLAIDIDNENDLAKSRVQTIAVIKRLFENYNLSSDDLYIYFSGSKGFHIAIQDKTLGQPPPHKQMGELCKNFVAEIMNGIEDVDYSIYENHRLFRVDNSLNEKSGLYKYQLSFDELEKFDIEAIKKRGKVPRVNFARNKKYNELLPNQNLISIWQKINLTEQNNSKEIVYTEGFFTPPRHKERDNKLFRQAAMLFDTSVLTKNAVYEILVSINNCADNDGQPPLTSFDINRIVDSAHNKTKDNPKKFQKQEEEIIVKSIGEWSKEWYENLLPQENELTLGFSKFDEEMRGRLRGKLGVVLGYGGTKKSLYVKNVAKNNADRNLRTIYSMMEMGIGDTINRFVDMKVNGETENATYALERMEKLRTGDALKIFSEQIAPSYGESILLTFNNSMTCEKYDKTIEKVMVENGKVDILIVDGLSMMGGDKNETERYSQNSKQLKDIANKYNILVLLICHASKGAEKHTRDLSKLIRSSEKILDNCDFYINFSTLIDEQKSTNEIVEYRNDKGYSRLVNKRGSGRSINTIFDFNSIVLHLTESHDDPKSFEIKRRQTSAIDL